MREFLSEVSSGAVNVFAIASMASVGLKYTIREILGPLRDLRGILLAIVANFVAVPLLAFLILRLLSLEMAYAIGLVLVASAAGAPFVVKLTQIAGGHVPFAAGVLVLQVLVSIAYMPLVVPLLAPEAEVNTWAIARPLILTLLLPFGVGLVLKATAPTSARALPYLGMLTTIALVVLVVLTFLLNLPTMLGVFGTGAVLASILLVIGAFVIGWVFGGFGEHLRNEMALATAQRNFAAAMVVATEAFESPNVLVMAVIVSLVTMALLFPAARLLRRHVAHGAKVTG
jgi:BASS family bile acid:Na+ symporter